MKGCDGREALRRHLFSAGAAHPFLRQPIEGMPLIPDASARRPATDGARIYYHPDVAPAAEAVEQMLIHCLFRHVLVPDRAVRPLWDLACDMSAEYLRTEFFPGREAGLTRARIADALPEDADPRVAGAVYRALMNLFEDELEPLYARFSRDDHRYWYAPADVKLFEDVRVTADMPPGDVRAIDPFREGDAGGYGAWKEEALENLWPSADELPGGGARTGRYGLTPGSREEKLLLRQEGKYDFSRYLRRFSTTREELRLDMGSFDAIPYYYGLMRYGNMPMIEPLEYAESHRVEALVIAIDTSGSCTRAVVERFLAEIQNMLMRHEYFFARMDVHIIQCDAVVQSHVAIHSLEEWQKYMKDFTIKGRSGTDFRPVFDLVAKLRERGELKRLKGLLYFTDGDGAYPQEKTPYETAFVFSTRRALEYKMPDWIIPLCLERE